MAQQTPARSRLADELAALAPDLRTPQAADAVVELVARVHALLERP
ncbi:hypothetical protein [Kineococcus sp. SYSU DK006]